MAPNNLACALRDLNRYDEAIEVLKPALTLHPTHPLLWNTLGSVLSEQGDLDTSVVFFDEALRLDPAFAKARYNRGNASHLGLGGCGPWRGPGRLRTGDEPHAPFRRTTRR